MAGNDVSDGDQSARMRMSTTPRSRFIGAVGLARDSTCHLPVTGGRRDVLEGFAAEGPTIVKTCSGIRGRRPARSNLGISGSVEPEQGPVHLQRLVSGADVRAHVVDDEVMAGDD